MRFAEATEPVADDLIQLRKELEKIPLCLSVFFQPKQSVP